jgi:hypothetical protein
MQEPKAEKGQRGQTGGRLKRNRRAKKLPQAPSEQARSKEGSPAYKMEDTKSRSPQFLWCRISNKGDQKTLGKAEMKTPQSDPYKHRHKS